MIAWKPLSDHLRETGKPDDGRYRCDGCGRVTPSTDLVDARELPQLPGRWVCRQVCTSQMDREAEAAAVAARAWPTDEQLNDLRAERDLRLLKTDWTQLLDNRTRLGPTNCERYDVHRAHIRAVVTFAKLGVRRDWPAPVVEEASSGAED